MLDRLTSDNTLGLPRCSINKLGKCLTMEEDMVRESQTPLVAVEAFIKGKVPPAVKLNVLGPRILCQSVEGHCSLCILMNSRFQMIC
jgi:hypothetical protein